MGLSGGGAPLHHALIYQDRRVQNQRHFWFSGSAAALLFLDSPEMSSDWVRLRACVFFHLFPFIPSFF